MYMYDHKHVFLSFRTFLRFIVLHPRSLTIAAGSWNIPYG